MCSLGSFGHAGEIRCQLLFMPLTSYNYSLKEPPKLFATAACLLVDVITW